MAQKGIVTGQSVTPTKYAWAKEMRHEMTPAEGKLWSRLRGSRLGGYHFRRQQVIEPHIVDFYCHQAGLVVEVDGGIHQEQQEYDRQREHDLQLLGLSVIRFSNTDISQNLEGVLEEILRSCRLAVNEDTVVDSSSGVSMPTALKTDTP